MTINSSNHSLWQLQQGAARTTHVTDHVHQFNQDISVKALTKKSTKMSESAFVFFRGTAHLYYHDLHDQQVLAHCQFNPPEAVTWLQGDVHVENYGVFCDAQGDVIFDLNDFDESWIDSYLYDLYRLAVSMVLVLEQVDPQQTWDWQPLIYSMSASYLEQLAYFQNNRSDKLEKTTSYKAYGKLRKFIAKAEAVDSRQKMLDKWTKLNGDERLFDLSNSKLEAVDQQTFDKVKHQVGHYHHNLTSLLKGNEDYFTVVDVAKRVNAGTGSLGTSRFYVLIDGHGQDEHDYRILDIKKQGDPSHFSYLPQSSIERMHGLFDEKSQGSRVAAAQQAMQVDADLHLGSMSIDGDSYSVRERSPYKRTLNSLKLDTAKRFGAMAEQWGSILATAHARPERDFDAKLADSFFEDVISSVTRGKEQCFHQQVYQFAMDYAAQVNADFNAFRQALSDS